MVAMRPAISFFVFGRPGLRWLDPSYFLAMRVLYQRRPEKCSLRTLFS